jgi:SAM-dependent methyltransferase
MTVRLNNLWWELRLGVSTRGWAAPPDHPGAAHYATMSYATVRGVLRHLALGPSDVFVDIGSGKGRVLCLAARQPVKQVIGVELQGNLCRQAEANAARLRGRRAPISVEQTGAQRFDYSSATVVFLFDPFEADTLRPVLSRIDADTRGHDVRIAYANPTQDAVFRQQRWLSGRDFLARADTGWEHDVVFYHNQS